MLGSNLILWIDAIEKAKENASGYRAFGEVEVKEFGFFFRQVLSGIIVVLY